MKTCDKFTSAMAKRKGSLATMFGSLPGQNEVRLLPGESYHLQTELTFEHFHEEKSFLIFEMDSHPTYKLFFIRPTVSFPYVCDHLVLGPETTVF